MIRNERKSQERSGRHRREGRGQKKKVEGRRDRWEQIRARGSEGIDEIWKENRKRGKREEG